MWLWQQLKFAKKTQFIGKLITLSFFVHIIAVFCLLFVYKDHAETFLHIQSVAQNVVVKVIPLTGIPKKVTRTKTITKLPVQAKKKVPALVPASKNKKSIQSTSLKQEAKKVEKKPVVKKTEKTTQEIKQNSVQPVAALNKEVKKSVEKNNMPQEPLKKQEKNVGKTQEIVKTEEKDNSQEEVKYVTQKEYNQLSAQQALQEAITDVWAPPAGMSKDLVCLVALTIDWNGKLKEHTLKNSSGVFVYDIAVQQALEEVKIPRELWGKSVTVAFKP